MLINIRSIGVLAVSGWLLSACGGGPGGGTTSINDPGSPQVPTNVPSYIPTPTPSPTPSPSPTPTPTPSVSPSPTPSPVPSGQGVALYGSVDGLVSGLELELEEIYSGQHKTLTETGEFFFPQTFTNGTDFSVIIAQQPEGQNCVLQNNEGTFNGLDFMGLSASCLGEEGYSLELMGFDSRLPSFVIAGLRVEDVASGEPVTQLHTDAFYVEENDQRVGVESYLTSEQIPKESVQLRTVLLLDVSTSIDSEEMEKLKTAAKTSLISYENDTKTSRLLAGQQQVAIYSFDSEITQLTDYTSNIALLEAAIDTIPNSVLERGNSTNLLGAMEIAAERWNDQIDLIAVERGYAVLLTDGEHNFDSRSPADIETDLTNFFGTRKKVYAIAVGNNVNLENLEAITASSEQVLTVNSFESAEDLEAVFTEIAATEAKAIEGLYRVYYATPKRQGINNATFSLVDNRVCVNSAACDESVSSDFFAEEFFDVSPTLFAEVSGGSEASDNSRLIGAGERLTIEAILRWANLTPTYTLRIENLVGEVPGLQAVGEDRWVLSFPAGFTSATMIIGETATGYEQTVTLNRQTSGVLAVSSATLAAL
ncbi:vWA domain-containing protein [Teredinibacter turnerae]|uniref:vWA domain-containing protein n=1 Tax=Teredinibacter turnerae TaxID=2426 RepID=UPI00039F3AC3|nr:vWA domain-containing protein [Teredinibacter turnerae]